MIRKKFELNNGLGVKEGEEEPINTMSVNKKKSVFLTFPLAQQTIVRRNVLHME